MNITTQEFLEIQDIKEGVLILKNNNIRGVLMVSSMNFALKSDDEQNAIIYSFQSFLNSLDFSCQIIIQSRKINITPYLDSIKNLEEKQDNELLKAQTGFYVVVPYSLVEIFGVGGVTKQFNFLNLFSKDKAKIQQFKDDDFEKSKNQLWQRMEFLAMGLKRCGLDVIPLTTPELIELFWTIHHPNEAEIGYSPKISPELLK